jgi:hypothetical protein
MSMDITRNIENRISFGSTGTVPASSLIVQVQGPSENKSFTVTATGRIGSLA